MKIEKISSKKFEQISSDELHSITGGIETSSRYSSNGTILHSDTFDWSNRNGSLNPYGPVMDNLRFAAPVHIPR